MMTLMLIIWVSYLQFLATNKIRKLKLIIYITRCWFYLDLALRKTRDKGFDPTRLSFIYRTARTYADLGKCPLVSNNS